MTRKHKPGTKKTKEVPRAELLAAVRLIAGERHGLRRGANLYAATPRGATLVPLGHLGSASYSVICPKSPT